MTIAVVYIALGLLISNATLYWLMPKPEFKEVKDKIDSLDDLTGTGGIGHVLVALALALIWPILVFQMIQAICRKAFQ